MLICVVGVVVVVTVAVSQVLDCCFDKDRKSLRGERLAGFYTLRK